MSQALLVVDMQRDFYVGGSLAVPDSDQILNIVNDRIRHHREAGHPIYFSKDWHPANTPHFTTWPKHCVAKTEGAEFIPGLDYRADDVMFLKGLMASDGYSVFEATQENHEKISLYGRMTLDGVDDLECVGLATDYCVRSTVLDALSTYSIPIVRVYLEACAAVDPETGKKAIEEMIEKGAIVE